ncbi:MAG: TolC family protein, partial [Deltaproteobacteria bacterium]|nr:TolC family protein [Nannocystaceae bacterium]
ATTSTAAPVDTGHAEAPSGDAITLGQLLGILRGKHPRMETARAKLEVARARRESARMYPNPIFNFQVLHLISGYNQNGLGTFTVYVQQPFYVAGQRIQRRKAARAQESAAEAEVTAAYHELAAIGRHAFVELQASQQHHGVLGSAVVDLERVRDVVASRYAAGAESKYDVARISLEVAEWRARIAGSNADIRDAAGRIGVIAGRPQWHPSAADELASSGLVADPDTLWPDVQRSQPAIELARRGERLAERELILARREAVPQPTVGFGMVGIDNFFSMSLVGGLTIPLPLFDWGQGQLAKAKADIRVAKAEKEAVVAESRAELDRAAGVLEQRKLALAQFERDVLAHTKGLQQMAEDAYVTGQASILELIDAIELHYDLELQRTELLEQVVHAEVDLLHVLGRIEEGT